MRWLKSVWVRFRRWQDPWYCEHIKDGICTLPLDERCHCRQRWLGL